MLGIVAAVGVATPAASGAAVRIGSDLAPDPVQAPSGAGASDPRTIATLILPGAQVASPIDGVVVRWRVRADGADLGGNSVRLKVIRPAGGGAYTGVSTSATRVVSDTLAPTTFTFPARQPIRAGDLIGLDISGPNGNFVVQTAIQAGLHILRWQPMPLLDGQTRAPDNDPSLDYGEHTFNADVEPDADCDGFGDETQDQSISGGCLPSPPSQPSNEFQLGKAKKNKRKGTAKLPVEVPGAGEVGLAGTKKVKGASARAEGAGSLKVPIKPKRKARRKLSETGKAKVTAEVTFAPDGGEPNAETTRIGLRKRL